MNPPSPPSAPPWAVSVPKMRVASSDQTTTVPPIPSTSASALTTASGPMWAMLALSTSGSAPCRPPPMRISPPPVAPEASISPMTETTSPVTWTLPPLPASSEASIFPPTSTTPSAPPAIFTSLLLTVPLLRMAMAYMSPAPRRMPPAGADRLPAFSTPGLAGSAAAPPAIFTTTLSSASLI